MILVINFLIICSIFSSASAGSKITIDDETFDEFDKFSNSDPDAYIMANKRRASVEEEFNLDRVIVVLKHKYSIVNRVIKASDFSSSLFCDVTDLSYVENYSTKDEMNVSRVNEDEFHQILSLKLRNPGKESVLKAIAYLNTCDEVLSAEPDYIYKCKDLYVPNDTYYDKQWGLERINIEDAWDKTRGSTDVKVGIFENGLSSHEDISSGRIIQGTRQYNSAEIHSHGTVVTGVIGATSNNNKGVAPVFRSFLQTPVALMLP